jgi:hypothetical protein
MANHAQNLRLEPEDGAKSAPAPKKEKRYEWFSIAKIADNDYRIVSFWAPLSEKYAKGPKMIMPSEVFDRWHIDCESLLDRITEDF